MTPSVEHAERNRLQIAIIKDWLDTHAAHLQIEQDKSPTKRRYQHIQRNRKAAKRLRA